MEAKTEQVVHLQSECSRLEHTAEVAEEAGHSIVQAMHKQLEEHQTKCAALEAELCRVGAQVMQEMRVR